MLPPIKKIESKLETQKMNVIDSVTENKLYPEDDEPVEKMIEVK